MVYVSRLIRHPRPGFRFLQEPLNQACGAQIDSLFIYRKDSVQKGLYPKKVLSKKGLRAQRSRLLRPHPRASRSCSG